MVFMQTRQSPRHCQVTSYLVNIRSTQDRQLLPKVLTNRCYFT